MNTGISNNSPPGEEGLFSPRPGDLPESKQAPIFVSRRTALELLDLSDTGFRAWQRRGILPPPVAGSPADEPRWDWAEICTWLRGDRSSAPRDLLGPLPAQAGKRRGPAPGTGGRPRKAPPE